MSRFDPEVVIAAIKATVAVDKRENWEREYLESVSFYVSAEGAVENLLKISCIPQVNERLSGWTSQRGAHQSVHV